MIIFHNFLYSFFLYGHSFIYAHAIRYRRYPRQSLSPDSDDLLRQSLGPWQSQEHPQSHCKQRFLPKTCQHISYATLSFVSADVLPRSATLPAQSCSCSYKFPDPWKSIRQSSITMWAGGSFYPSRSQKATSR